MLIECKLKNNYNVHEISGKGCHLLHYNKLLKVPECEFSCAKICRSCVLNIAMLTSYDFMAKCTGIETMVSSPKPISSQIFNVGRTKPAWRQGRGGWSPILIRVHLP